jgi:hypothetical protein
MLKPELQDEDQYADSIKNLLETGKNIAERYFNDNSVEKACPPLKALLTIMTKGEWEGNKLTDKKFRDLFEPQNILQSEWYNERLKTRIQVTQNYWESRVEYLDNFIKDQANKETCKRLSIQEKKDFALNALSKLKDNNSAVARIFGCLGTDPSLFN